MNPRLQAGLQKLLDDALDSPRIRASQPVSGGCINDVWRVDFSDNTSALLKVNRGDLLEMFRVEAAGLNALATADAIRIPNVLLCGKVEETDQAILLMEWIETGRAHNNSSRDFGAALARLHQTATSNHFGFEHDNYLGSTPQPNKTHASWTDFWRHERLGYQFKLARQDGYATGEFHRLAQRVLDRVDEWIAEPDEPPTLLHGDLWSGNYLFDQQGRGVLIDPAVYYGRREAELAMTRLFGGFDRDFYQGYQDTWPLAPGAETRIRFYQLYHVLNHLHLFGTSYLSQAINLMKEFA